MNDDKYIVAINAMQDILHRKNITEIPDSWKIFAEFDSKNCKGLVILYQYTRLTCEPDYNTGNVAELEIFTFPEYRKQGVCQRLLRQAIEYGKSNGIDIVADCLPAGYKVTKSVGFKDSTEKRVWMHLS